MAKTLCRQYLHNPELHHQTSRLLLTKSSRSRVTLNQLKMDASECGTAKPMSAAMPHPPQLTYIGSVWRLPWMLLTTSTNFEALFKDYRQI